MSKNKLFSAFLAFSLLFLSACSEETKPVVPDASLITPEQTNYETVPVTASDYTKPAQGGGALYFTTYAELTWDTANSRIEEIYVDRGSMVKKGDVLASFTTEIRVSELENLRLQLQRAQEALEEGKAERMKEINHAKRVLDYNFSREKKIAQLELESMQISYDMYVYQQEDAIAKIAKKIADIEELVTENTIVAPYDGIVESVISYNPGDSVNKGAVIVKMYDTSRFYVGVKEGANKLRYNQTVALEAGRKNQRKQFSGRVITAPDVLPEEAGAVALIEVDDNITPEDLRISVNYQVNTEEMTDVIMIGRQAITQENGKFYVNVLEDDMVKKRYITVGSNNLQEYWVLDGLTEGQILVLD